jgi:hypothetical protein
MNLALGPAPNVEHRAGDAALIALRLPSRIDADKSDQDIHRALVAALPEIKH